MLDNEEYYERIGNVNDRFIGLIKEIKRLRHKTKTTIRPGDIFMAHKKGLRLGKATADNGYGMFVNMLTYKLADRGKWLEKVDKFFPSSQLCQCGYQNPITKDLGIRTITCPVCGRTYDRDINAAINIRNEGYRLYKSA